MWRAESGRCAMKFDQYLNGMVELRLPARRTEEALQQLTAAGVHVYQVRRQDDVLYLCIHLDDFAVVQHLLRERRCRFHVHQRYGLPFIISRLKRRRGLWLGAGLGLAMVYLLLSFIWGYEVSGNVQYSDEHLIALVQEYGMIPGSRTDKFDYAALASQIVLEHPEFTWIQLQTSGTTLQITVKERLTGEPGQHKTGSLVARADGKITELLVFRGTALVKRGDWVTRGQVLIGGWDYPDRQRGLNGEFGPAGEPYRVEAQAVVYGEQERCAIGSCALEEKILVPTGQEAQQISLEWNGHHMVLWGPKESPYTYSGQQTEQRSLIQWKQYQVPIYIKTTTFTEKKIQAVSYTKEEAYVMAVERARKRLQEQMPSGSRFLHESTGIYQPENQTVIQAEVVWLVEENLAQMLQEPLPAAVPTEETEQTMKQVEQATGVQ